MQVPKQDSGNLENGSLGWVSLASEEHSTRLETLSVGYAVGLEERRVLRSKAHSHRDLTSQVQRQAQERAAELARHVPWQVLFETRNQYLAWQEFYSGLGQLWRAKGQFPGGSQGN